MYAILAFLVLLALAPYCTRAALFINKKTYMGPDFFEDFTWETADDPTHGRVNFVDLQTALRNNLTAASTNKFVMRVDSTTVVSNDSRGRDSIRIISNDAYDDAIVLIDLSHMPFGAAVWPAFWTLSGEGPWPNGAEIDIIEGVNYDTQNLASLHTTSSCYMAQQRAQSGFTVSTNCDAAVNYNQGCGTRFIKPNSYGSGFNSAGGGWFAMERSREDGVKVWFWSKHEDNVPRNIRDADTFIDPSSFGMPSASFPKDTCDYDTHFNAHRMIFDMTLCGDWAGSEFSSTGILGSCNEYVDATPNAFQDAYWEVYKGTTPVIHQSLPSFRTTMFLLKVVVALSVPFLAASAAPLFPSNNLELEKRDDDLPARIPYIFPAPGTDPLADAIRERHGTLLDLDGLLLNAPKLASGWNDLFGAIRDGNSLPGTMRELFILRTAVLNSATYQWLQHESVGREEGLTTEQLRIIRFTPPFIQTKHTESILGPQLSAAMSYADWITKSIRVPDTVFSGLKQFLNDQQIVEATMTAGSYNLVSRFVVALDADAKMNVPVPFV
ncbi:hypothetical protein EYR40_006645 [Pleurotus pulmonarius]|nr:hypothetical protein EYR40_006645 [Pleurotus pulmonarius]